MSTLIGKDELHTRLSEENCVNADGVNVICPRWAESAPLRPGVRSFLPTSDALVREDGSAVLLDGMMSTDGSGIVHAWINYDVVAFGRDGVKLTGDRERDFATLVAHYYRRL